MKAFCLGLPGCMYRNAMPLSLAHCKGLAQELRAVIRS